MDEIKKSIKDQYRELCKRLDNKINFLSFLPCNENKHTDLLKTILSYRLNEEHSFIKSFLKCAFSDITIDDEWKISTQNNYIDCLLQGKKNAIIIENKVCGACDQHKQIESYIEKMCLNYKYDLNNIYVIYLTLFGGSPNQDSLSDKRKEELGDRYAEINYKNDLLPWIENDVLPQCPYREQTLICSLYLYIDYLKKMLGIDIRQQTIAKEVLNILSKYGLREYSTVKNKLLEAQEDEEYSKILNTVLRQMEKENPYCNDTNVSYNLKWILRNNPTPDYKSIWIKRDYSPFNSIGYFTGGIRIIQLATTICEKYIRIHLQCNAEGIKNGPYLLADNESDIKSLWDIDSLVKDGFLLKEHGRVLSLPFEEFSQERSSLIDVSEFIWNMIQMLNKARINTSCNA